MDYEAFYQELRNPEFIPGYEVLQKIGGGVFGEVFKIRKKSISRIYVVKFLKLDHEAQRHVIEKELASLRNFAQIDHPNLVGIEDQGTVHDIPYIIMTFAGDQTLQDRLRAGGIQEDELLSLFDQILSGVAALHQRSIVHFDLKPANIFLRDSTVRVGDYGLSKMLSASRQSLSFGRGTPYYMAPEVMKRKGDLRADVYSLGAILYELATGRVPFDGDSDWEVLRKHEVDSIDFPRDLRPEIRALVQRAMQKDPESRFADATAFRREFRAQLGLDGVTRELPVGAPAAMSAPEATSVPAGAASTATERVNRLAQTTSTRLREMADPDAAATSSTNAAPHPAGLADPARHAPTRETPSAAPQPRRGHRRFLTAALAVFAVVGVLVVMFSLRGGVSRMRNTPIIITPEALPARPRPIDAARPRPIGNAAPRNVGGNQTPAPQEEVDYGKTVQFLHFLLNDKRQMPKEVREYFQDIVQDFEKRE